MTTMTTIPLIIAAIQDTVGAVSGISSAPDIPPEQTGGSGVFAFVYPASGIFSEIAAGGREQGAHTFHLMLATYRTNLRTDWNRIIGLGDTVARALFNAGTMSGLIVQSGDLRYTFGDLEWGGQQLFGWLFEVDILATGGLS